MTSRWKVWLVFLCVVVIVFTTTAEASHFHPDMFALSPLSKPLPKKPNTNCLVCNALHAPAISSTTVAVVVAVSKSNETVPEAPRSASRTVAFDLSVRPPPSVA